MGGSRRRPDLHRAVAHLGVRPHDPAMKWIDPRRLTIPSAAEALAGREEGVVVAPRHVVLGANVHPPFEGLEMAMFAMGCFWGAERRFWQTAGVKITSVGYAGGHTRNATYQEVCSGR